MKCETKIPFHKYLAMQWTYLEDYRFRQNFNYGLKIASEVPLCIEVRGVGKKKTEKQWPRQLTKHRQLKRIFICCLS